MIIIYKTTNIITKKFYVGKHSKDDPNYLGSGTYLKSSIKKYGKKNFIRETLEVVTIENWQEREKFWIRVLDAQNPLIGYNIMAGGGSYNGNADYVYTDEVREKMSKIHSGTNNHFYGKKHTEETKEIISKLHKGRKHSQEHCNKKGEILKKRWEDNSEQFNFSDEIQKKRRDALMITNNKKYNPNNYEKPIRTFKKENTSRPVIINGIEYNSITEAAYYLKMKRESVGYRLRSKYFPDYQYLPKPSIEPTN